MTKMSYTFDSLLFLDIYEMIAEMGNKTAEHRLNWISYFIIVCIMRQTLSVGVLQGFTLCWPNFAVFSFPVMEICLCVTPVNTLQGG